VGVVAGSPVVAAGHECVVVLWSVVLWVVAVL